MQVWLDLSALPQPYQEARKGPTWTLSPAQVESREGSGASVLDNPP